MKSPSLNQAFLYLIAVLALVALLASLFIGLDFSLQMQVPGKDAPESYKVEVKVNPSRFP